MSDVSHPMPLPPFRTGLAATGLALLATMAGCSGFRADPGAQAALNQRIVGQPSGDFFATYGPWKGRAEQPDGTVAYEWISAIGPTPNSGFYGLDDRTCELRLVAARNGRITEATVYRDMPGRISTSRCAELFNAR